MRKVLRTAVAPPDVLQSPDAKGPKERAKLIKHFEKWLANSEGQKEKEPTFSVYKDKSIALALYTLFYGKCAYCESRFAGIHPVDIEHWRPKGAVFLGDGTLREYGYYWLAATWENLLPACIDCNRIRTHWDYVEKREINLGKGNWFPLSDESKRAKLDEEGYEDPLLLNPCNDDPCEHLEFDGNGCVSPRRGSDGLPSKKALASIKHYALNRTELVQDRRARILLIKQKMDVIRKLALMLQENTLPEKVEFMIEDLLAFELEALHRFQKPDEPFATMSGHMIESFIAEFAA